MKTLFIGLMALFILSTCNKDKSGNILHRVKFTTDKSVLKSEKRNDDSLYSGLGTFITSITPTNIFSKLNIMMFQTDWDHQSNINMISYINGHDNDPRYEIFLNVDFTANAEVKADPILYGNMRNGLFEDKENHFKFFYFVPYYFKLRFEVPAQYNGKNIMGQNGTYETDLESGKRYITVNHQPLLQEIFGNGDQQPFGYFFGGTDSTFIFNQQHADVPRSVNHPNGGKSSMIRSHKFDPITVNMPDGNEKIEMVSTVGFLSDDLIQVYAGKDKIAYTQDDIFVFAPKYWERLRVKLEVR